MEDKKQIEEIAEVIDDMVDDNARIRETRWDGYIALANSEKIAEELLKHYQIVNKDSVVMSREEYAELKQAKTLLELREETIKYLEDANIRYAEALELKVNKKERKETAREIYHMADDIITGSQNDGDKILVAIREKYGVEVE